ncbi:protein Wiz isoform X8 [Anolis carolinensis]|uniref:protein Wiz isoform X8 n=1 Tax=Anolis carolinensis TaxID=28377 RepID=UPI000462763C|nr:PREDICTED: protein Wiz isoform X7 [Anolis carolinensis]|eukprot:XP_008102463.1 PREDICTED: protein Wiz isoform X7 [Anolis carolinensis]
MEKVVSTALSEQEKEPKDGEEKAVLMTVVSNNDLASLESSQDEERTAVFLKDAKTPPNSMALLSPSKEKEIGLKETVHSSSKKPEAINREGKGTDVMGSPKEDPSFLLSFTHQEPDGTLEACAKTDELSPSLGVVTITDRRKESRSKAEHRLKFRKGCYKADSRRSADQRSTTVLWDYSTQETVGRVSKEESTLERLPGLKDSESTKDISWKNPSYSEEPTSAVESNIMKTVQMNTDDQEGELEHLEPGMAAGEVSPQLDGAQTVSGDERYHSNEPKQLESFSKEHLDRKQELENKGFQTLDWLSEHNEGLGPPYRSINKPTDVATNLSVRGQLAREASLLALPVFRKTLKPHLSKAKTAESAPSPRKGQAMNSDLGDVSPGNTAEWALQTSGIQTATDLAVRKRTWSIRGRDTVEHVRPRSAESPTGSAYDDETRPYISSLLLDEQGKEDIGQEEDPTVYTCIECSIYFKMKEHLMDHMLQHNRGLDLDQDREDAEDQCQLTCNECGWAFGDIDSLEQHRRLHQESREKIIEEIQKLDEFPDEGRDARLQCPKCVFGTNSSKVFVQHAKMHVRERKDQSLKHVNLFGNSGGSEPRDSSIHNIYRHFRPNERLPQTTHMHSSNKGHSTCMLCSFPAPNDNILKEHMKYTHSQLPWNTETFEADMNQPGTSRDTYSPNRSSRFSESDYLSKADRFFPQSHGEIIYDSPPPFPGGHHRLNKSNGSNKKEIPKPGFRARKRAPYSTSQKILEMSSLTSANAYSPHALKERNKSTMLPLDSERENAKSHPVANFDPGTFSLMRCEFCGAGFDTRAGLSSHARAHLRDFGITNWELTISPINILKELLANSSEHPMLQSALGTDPSSPNQDREMLGFRPCKSTTPISECSISQSPFSPFPPSWGDEPMQSFRDVMASEDEEEIVTTEMGSPPLQKKSPLAGSLDQIPNRIGGSLSPEISSNKTDSQDSKTPNLTTCEVCGTCFETRKGLSSHARSHLRQLGVAESESSGAPIDLLYELMKQKGKVDSGPISPSLSKKSASPKEGTAGSTRPTLLPLSKAPEQLQEPPVNKAIKSPPGFTPKNVAQPASPLFKKVVPALPGSPLPKNPEDKSPKLPLSPLQSSPNAQWPQPEEEGPLNLTVDSDSGRENDCQLCGAWFETRKGLSSHARAHLRHLGVSDPDAKGSPIDVLNELIKNEDFKGHLSSLLSSERESLGETESSDGPSPKSTATAAPATGMKQVHSPRPLGKQPSLLSPQSPPSSKKMKPNGHRLSAVANLQRKQGLSSSAYWASDAEMAPLNLSSGAEPVRDIRCEFCGEYFENRKGLSSHARSHLRQMGVTEWYVNGSPIDTLREIMKRRSQPRTSTSSSPAQGQKSVALPVLGSSLEPHSPGEGHVSAIPKKAHPPGSPMGHSSTSSSPPTARKIFPGLPSPSSLHKKLKQDQLHMEIKREMLSGGLHNDSHLSDRAWSPREDMSPLNLSSRADPVRDIRCEFCGEFFENRKGLSSHARSHLRQMGVTEWSVNGSPIDTLREIIKKKNKPYFIKKEPNTMSIELPKSMGDEGFDPKSHGKMLQSMTLSPLGGRTGKPNLGREVSLSPLKSQEGFFTTLSTKRPLSDERLSIHHSEMKHKTYIQTELPFKAKHMHEKPTHTSSEACCELCGLYFENRKALASHARAHLRQFGVTEWCVNGSPIETLSEWIKHRPQKAGAYRSYIQGGRPFTKKFRNASHFREIDLSGKRVPLSLHAGSPLLASRSLLGEMLPSEPSKAVDCGSSGERPVVTSPLSLVKVEEHQHHNINKFERRQAKPIEAPLPREDEASDVQQKADEARQPPLRVRPVPSLVPRPPQTSLVKFVGNIYTLKCRFCEVEFQGPLSIQEEWVRHLQRHILETNFSKADGLRSEIDVPMAPPIAEAQ